jgi:DNA-binding transcriptional LysR family regulator
MSRMFAQPGWEAVGAALASREEGQLFSLLAPARPMLTVGLCSSMSCGLLRELVRSTAEAPNPPELAFRESSPGRIRRSVRRREVDVAFVCGSVGIEGLERQALWCEPVLAALPEHHPLAHASEVAAEDLLRQRFLTYGGASEHVLQAELIAQILGGLPAKLDCLPVERETLLELTALGQGVTLVTGSAAAVFHPGVAYRPIHGAQASVSLNAIWKAGGANAALGPFIAQARALALRGPIFGVRPW